MAAGLWIAQPRLALAATLESARAEQQSAPTPIAGAETQPLAAQVRRVILAMDAIGAPLANRDVDALEAAMTAPEAHAGELIQAVLDAYCLVVITINPEMRVSVAAGPTRRELLEAGWRSFLVKVYNQAGTTARLQAVSPNGQSAFSYLPPRDKRGPGRHHNVPNIVDPPDYVNASDRAYEADRDAERTGVADRWLDLEMHNSAPLMPTLSGAVLEYRILSLYSRDVGPREATLAFDVGQGTQDLGFRAEIALLFECRAAQTVRLRVREAGGARAFASFVIRDAQGRVYPSRAKRQAPDLAFQPQIYRGDGETVRLPAGRYSVECWRGPESLKVWRDLVVPEAREPDIQREEEFVIRRWIDPSAYGYWSGDHHIHAAGCAHYVQPTEGVRADDMLRQTAGEDLKVGATLTWGPGFDYQKYFFSGHDDPASRPPYLIHYDIEVSGFGSHQSGHLVLLGLKSQIYPGGESYAHWPTLGLNILRWAKAQGAICGAAHSGWGLAVDSESLPNHQVPAYDGIGANEFIVNVTHKVPGPSGDLVPAVDFLSLCDTPYIWELNMWYHTLNAGFRQRAGGETDFPCIYGERVGMGRSYVRMPEKLNYRDWCEGLREGRGYVSEGRAHLLEFRVDDRLMGEGGSELRLKAPGRVRVTLRAGVLLPERPDETLAELPYTVKPFWHIERARLRATRSVAVELVVNGECVARKAIPGDGSLLDVEFDDIHLVRSAWLAVRILPAAHTNPVFVIVGEKPIRASRRSIQWCLSGVDHCWSQKSRFIRPSEEAAARAAYEHARAVYRKRLTECDVD